jgi:hypothetical protein
VRKEEAERFSAMARTCRLKAPNSLSAETFGRLAQDAEQRERKAWHFGAVEPAEGAWDPEYAVVLPSRLRCAGFC